MSARRHPRIVESNLAAVTCESAAELHTGMILDAILIPIIPFVPTDCSASRMHMMNTQLIVTPKETPCGKRRSPSAGAHDLTRYRPVFHGK